LLKKIADAVIARIGELRMIEGIAKAVGGISRGTAVQLLAFVILLFPAGMHTLFGEEGRLPAERKEQARGALTQKETKPRLCVAFLSEREPPPGAWNELTRGRAWSVLTLITKYADLVVLNYDSAGVLNVTNDASGMPWECAWSPDGRYLTWLSHRGLEMFSNGNRELLLSRERYEIETYAWSPASDQIAFWCSETESEKSRSLISKLLVSILDRPSPGYEELYLMKLADRSPKRILRLKARPLTRPGGLTWLRDGNRLAWTTWDTGVECLFLSRKQRPIRRKNIFHPKGVRCNSLSASYDGSWLSVDVVGYTGDRRSVGSYTVPVALVFSPEGKNIRRLTNTVEQRETSALFCPSDANLAALLVKERKPGGAWCLYLCHLDSGVSWPVDLPEGYVHVDGCPSWSKDGRYLVVGCVREDNPSASDLLALDIAASQWSRLTDSSHRICGVICRP
jgi:hypothetical protein